MSGVAEARAVEAPVWLTDFYAKADALDTEAVLAGFAPDATMRYGSGDPMPHLPTGSRSSTPT
jgi:hypothetical protein